MVRIRRGWVWSLAALGWAACSSDNNENPDGGGTLPDASGGQVVTLSPGATDQDTVQAALIAARPGTTIQFNEGTYHFTDELSLTVSGVTLKGNGNRDNVVLEFSGQATGGNGLLVTANDFTLQDMTIRDTAGDAVRVNNGTNVTFRNVKVFWSRGSAAQNGGYALYPVGSTNVLVENCDAAGASDAAIYVGQSSNIIVRNNSVHGSVNGIEIENSTNAEVSGNTSTDNVAGILVFNLPNLPVKTGMQALVHDNMVIMNNRAQFAAGGSVASLVPPGSGIVILAADQTEVRNNTIMSNNSTGVVVAACVTLEAVSGGAVQCTDPPYDPYPEGTFIHDNVFSGNGTNPQGFFQLFYTDRSKPFADILWDSAVNPASGNTATNALCIQNNGSATFAAINPASPSAPPATDLAAHNCTHPALPGVTLP